MTNEKQYRQHLSTRVSLSWDNGYYAITDEEWDHRVWLSPEMWQDMLEAKERIDDLRKTNAAGQAEEES